MFLSYSSNCNVFILNLIGPCIGWKSRQTLQSAIKSYFCALVSLSAVVFYMFLLIKQILVNSFIHESIINTQVYSLAPRVRKVIDIRVFENIAKVFQTTLQMSK